MAGVKMENYSKGFLEEKQMINSVQLLDEVYAKFIHDKALRKQNTFNPNIYVSFDIG